MRIHKGAFIGLLLTLQCAMVAKDRPNFSGNYVSLSSKASKHGGEAVATEMVKVVQSERTLEVSYTTGEKVRKCTYNLDGSETQNYTTGGAPSRDKAHLKGDKLIIQSIVSAKNGMAFSTTETWSLSRDSNQLKIHFTAAAASGLVAGLEIAADDREYLRRP